MFRAESPLGSDPRCWAGHIDGASDEVCLKDSWIDFTRNSEPSVMINKLGSGACPNSTAVHHGYVRTADGKVDSTFRTPLKNQCLPYGNTITLGLRFVPIVLPSGATAIDSVRNNKPASITPHFTPASGFVDRHMVRYRMVVREVRLPLCELDTLARVFRVLGHGVLGESTASAAVPLVLTSMAHIASSPNSI